MNEQDTLHRHDDGGPTATVVCDGNVATATWSLPEGQLLSDHPELNTGGYVYFTLEETPTIPLPNGAVDFSGVYLKEGTSPQITAEVELGVQYRAHLLAAYEDGPAWHNDTRFTCEEVLSQTISAEDPVEVLPFTGVDPLLVLLASLSLIVGALLLLTTRGVRE